MAEECNDLIQIIGDSETTPQVDPEILNITDKGELNYCLSKLVVEVRKKKQIQEEFTRPIFFINSIVLFFDIYETLVILK